MKTQRQLIEESMVEIDGELSDFLCEVTKGGAEIDSLDRYPSVRKEAEKLKSFLHQKLLSLIDADIQEMEGSIDEKWRGRIICGFAGIGKSVLAKKYAGVVDLESTPFERDWKRYATVARHMAKNGYTVLVSCHKEIREELHSGYIVAKPANLDRKEYLQRYKNRGNDETFIKMMDENWDKFIELLPHESEYVLVKNNLEDTLIQKKKDLKELLKKI